MWGGAYASGRFILSTGKVELLTYSASDFIRLMLCKLSVYRDLMYYQKNEFYRYIVCVRRPIYSSTLMTAFDGL